MDGGREGGWEWKERGMEEEMKGGRKGRRDRGRLKRGGRGRRGMEEERNGGRKVGMNRGKEGGKEEGNKSCHITLGH